MYIQTLFFNTIQSNLITTKLIFQGHAPAGGCLLAMSCEYRVMVNGRFTIGMNESSLGIIATKWFMLTILNTISQRDAEMALTTSKMFSTDVALKVTYTISFIYPSGFRNNL